ncbi:MAG: hypothetical protein ACQEQ4_10775 [Fibrobacterota bacterium]
MRYSLLALCIVSGFLFWAYSGKSDTYIVSSQSEEAPAGAGETEVGEVPDSLSDSEAPRDTDAAVLLPEEALSNTDGGGPSPGNDTAFSPQETCPVTGKPISREFFLDYSGMRIFGCSQSCIDVIRQEPEKYIEQLRIAGEIPVTL